MSASLWNGHEESELAAGVAAGTSTAGVTVAATGADRLTDKPVVDLAAAADTVSALFNATMAAAALLSGTLRRSRKLCK